MIRRPEMPDLGTLRRWGPAWLLGLGFAIWAILAYADGGSRTDGAPGSTNPHGNMKEECDLCHTADSWKPARVSPKFDHGKYGFPLTGAHKRTPCLSCHSSLEFARNPAACAGCHEDVHDSELGEDCAHCHTTRSFIDRSRMEKEHQLTRFPLTGAHLALDCATCHSAPGPGQYTFVGQSSECESCHLKDYEGAMNPDHAANGFAKDCTLCHFTTLWSRTDFDHGATTFPLTGAHRSVACAGCHGEGAITKVDAACVACHRPAYDATTNPTHADFGFSLDCATCHNTTIWTDATFDHAATGFALSGAHRDQTCASCHGSGPITPLDPACAACHRPAYDATTNPNHTTLGFPLECASCHNTTTWAGATFDHAATGFALTGAHRDQTCAKCHGSGPIAHLDPACAACHRAAYDATANPNHTTAHFSLDCATCHSTTSWAGATFNHDATFFPIYSGAHAGTWTACATCHTSPSNYAEFSCLGCHPHDNKAKTDGDHGEVRGYRYDSVECYSCHPRGGH